MATRISVSGCKVRGKKMWRVRHWEGGKPRRKFFDSKTKADAEAAMLKVQADRAGAVWLSLPAHKRDRLISVYMEAEAKGIDLQLLVARGTPDYRSPAIGVAIGELKVSKLNNGANKGYVKNLAIVLNQFARGRETVPIDKFTLADVEKFLDSKSLQYRATVRGKLSTLFNFCVRRGYRLDNPCSRLEPIKVTKAPPQIFTVKQFATAAEWFKSDQPKGLSWFALATLCGLRPEEAEKTTEADIHFKEGFVKVEAQTTKVRQRRVVYPKPEAMAFLEWSLKNGGVLPIGKAARMKIISGRKSKYPGLRHALDFTAWPKDITRHTAASYWLASDGSAAHVADMLGNSERVLKRDYKALVTRAEAVEFWRAVTSACNYEHTSRRAA